MATLAAFANAASLNGIDVSSYQGNIDWSAVAGSGISLYVGGGGGGGGWRNGVAREVVVPFSCYSRCGFCVARAAALTLVQCNVQGHRRYEFAPRPWPVRAPGGGWRCTLG